ncbi:MAG: choice-of-anchor B family protein [Gemmatimonadales bacterium]|nr:choice-of-anchor B family protein [Gemmatimonadales bacterium]
MTLLPFRLFATVLLGAAVGCGNSGSDPVIPPPAPPPPPPSGGVVTIDATPGTLTFPSLGTTQQVAATPRNAAGGSVAAPVTFTTRRTGIVQVSASGLVTSVGNGADTVVASAGGISALIPVNVTQVAASVQLTAPAIPLDLAGATVALVAQARDANNRVIAGTLFTFSSSNAAALPVDGLGLVTAARGGTARITATLGTLSGFVDVTAAFTGPLGPSITGALTVCNGGMAGPFPCQNVDLVAYLPRSAIGTPSTATLNDIWGWTDPQDGKEYAIVLRRDGTSFVDVSVPSDPRFVGYLPITAGANPNVWHDVKVYQNRAYIVADAAGAHGMQVFDLTQLRGVTSPRVFAPNSVYRNINSAHNIAINTASGFGYIVGASGGGTTCGGGLHMVDLRNPATPVFAGCFADTQTGRIGTGYTHDVQCVNYVGPDAQHVGREICFGANETAISIADVTVKTAPVALSRASYPAVAYTHQGWLTEDQRYFLVNDELDEQQGTANTRTLVWDVTDLDDPILVTQYFGPTRATDHNHYIRGTRMFMSNYQYGLRVVDVSSPTAPVQFGFFDTAPALSNTPGFGGSWSNYPFFPSGIIVMSSSTEGFFVLRAR